MKKMNKKGIEEQFIIMFVVGILGLGIVLFFYAQTSWGTVTDKDVCHQSALYRSTFNTGVFEPGREEIPLKCTTENICLDETGEKCKKTFGKKTSENPITTIEVKDENDIKEAISNALVDCHSMLGEGNLNFMPTHLRPENYCVICSRIILDKKDDSKINDLEFLDLYNYMEKQKNTEGQTYLDYVYGDLGTDADTILDKVASNSNNQLKKETMKIDLDYENGNVIIVSIGKDGNFWKSLGAVGVGGLTTTALMFIPAVGPLAAIATSGGTSTFIFSKYNNNGQFQYNSPAIVPYDSESLNQLKCTRFESAP